MTDQQRFSAAAKPWVGTLLAIVATLATFGFVQARYPLFVVSSEYDIGMGASTEARLALQQQTQLVERKNAMVIFALGSSLLAAGLASVAEGCCAMPIRMITGFLWGAVWGTVTGWVASLAQSVFIPYDSFPSVTTTGMSQAFAFGFLGAGIGLMLGGYSRNARTAIASAITAMIAGGGGGFLFAIVVGFVADSQNSGQLVPDGAVARLLWLTLPFAAIGFLLSQPKPTPQSSVAAPVELSEATGPQGHEKS